MDKAYQDLKKIFERKSILSDIDNILQWDLSTIMPEKSRENRTKQLSLLSELKCEIFTDTKIKELFKNVDKNKLSCFDYSNFKEMQKVFTYFSAVPQKLIKKKTELVSKCEGKWREAKALKNFCLVKKELSELIKVVKEESKFLSETYECSKYDALLKCYEYSYNTSKIEVLFKNLKNFISQKYDKILKKQVDIKYDKIHINEKEQLELSKFFMVFGCAIPINFSDFILSLTISKYLGSKIFKGTVVFGKIIKLLRGKIGIIFGKFII